MRDSILTPLQRIVLDGFFTHGGSRHGYHLTGGTALSEFYLRHRVSDDLDLFTRKENALAPEPIPSHRWPSSTT